MNPRRLIPYIIVFLVLAAAYAGLLWYQQQQLSKEQEAKKIFRLKEDDIGELSLTKGNEEIRLVKKGRDWNLVKPLETRADQATVDAMLVTLATLQQGRDLGPPADLKTFGLATPSLVVSFTAQGQAHRLLFGNKAPGNQAYYVLKDQDPDALLVGAGSKEALDRTVSGLRDKTLLTFLATEVKAIKIRTGKEEVQLEKTGPQAWRWTGEDIQVRPDRVEKLLRDLQASRIKDFLTETPKDLRAAGLAPRPQIEVTMVTDQGSGTLSLGPKKDGGVYARQGAGGQLVLVDPNLPGEIIKAIASLEERRLFTGGILEVQKVVWGPPSKPWVAVQDKDFWKITAPGQAEVRQPAARLVMALVNFQNLEYSRILPQAGTPARKDAYKLELFDQGGKLLFLAEDLGPMGQGETQVLTRVGDKAGLAAVDQKKWTAWQEEMTRLTVPPPK